MQRPYFLTQTFNGSLPLAGLQRHDTSASPKGKRLRHQASAKDSVAELEATSKLVHHQSVHQAELSQVTMHHSKKPANRALLT